MTRRACPCGRGDSSKRCSRKRKRRRKERETRERAATMTTVTTGIDVCFPLRFKRYERIKKEREKWLGWMRRNSRSYLFFTVCTSFLFSLSLLSFLPNQLLYFFLFFAAFFFFAAAAAAPSSPSSPPYPSASSSCGAGGRPHGSSIPASRPARTLAGCSLVATAR